MSELGTSKSPVAEWISVWWVVYGILLVIYAIGFGKSLHFSGIPIKLITIAIIIFGVGAGIGAGIFPADPDGKETTLSGKIHGISAGMGFLAIVFLPLISLTLFKKQAHPNLFLVLVLIQIAGLLFFFLFLTSGKTSLRQGILGYSGLWQRLFLLNYYTFFIMIAIKARSLFMSGHS